MEFISNGSWDRAVAAAREATPYERDANMTAAEARAASLAHAARRKGVAVMLRLASARLRTMYPGAVPPGIGAFSDDELIGWWAQDPITPIRVAAGASSAFAGRPGAVAGFFGDIGDAFAWVWRVAIGVGTFIVLVVIVGGIVWAVRAVRAS